MEIRVYYEDTDLAGIVYYANYFRFIERGRTEMLRAAGIDQMAMKAETGVVFAVRKLTADFLAPAKMDDVLTVETEVASIGPARIDLEQRVICRSTTLFTSQVTLVCIGTNGRASRIPKELAIQLQ